MVNSGATIAGVAIGGVVLSALTAGIALVPIAAIVSTAVVAGGGAVAYTASHSTSLRVVLAAETLVRNTWGVGVWESGV